MQWILENLAARILIGLNWHRIMSRYYQRCNFEYVIRRAS